MHYNNEYCKERNIKFCHIVFPAKMVALKELFKKIGISIFPLFDKEHQLESVYYPLSKLDAFRHYSKTDTHINDRGSSVILKHLLKGLDIEWCR